MEEGLFFLKKKWNKGLLSHGFLTFHRNDEKNNNFTVIKTRKRIFCMRIWVHINRTVLYGIRQIVHCKFFLSAKLQIPILDRFEHYEMHSQLYHSLAKKYWQIWPFVQYGWLHTDFEMKLIHEIFRAFQNATIMNQVNLNNSIVCQGFLHFVPDVNTK